MTAQDVDRARENLVGATPGGTFIAERCNVIGPRDPIESNDCFVDDIFVLERTLLGGFLPPVVDNGCNAYFEP